MKIKLELFGASKDFSKKTILEFNLKDKCPIKELRQEVLKFIDSKFKGNKTYKKLVSSSVFCSEDNNIIHDDFKIK